MHRQPANAATCGHARAIGDRNGRGGQHAGANSYSDDYSHSYSHRNSVPHANTVADSYRDTHPNHRPPVVNRNDDHQHRPVQMHDRR